MGVPVRMQCRFSKNPEDPNEPICRRRKDAIIGKCDSCQDIFCSEHRFIETHNCKQQEYVSLSRPRRALVQWWMVGLDADLLRDCCGDNKSKATWANIRTLADKTEALCRKRRAVAQGAHSGCEDIDESAETTQPVDRYFSTTTATTIPRISSRSIHHITPDTAKYFALTIPTPHQGRTGTGRLFD
jgi:hypothetical protein